MEAKIYNWFLIIHFVSSIFFSYLVKWDKYFFHTKIKEILFVDKYFRDFTENDCEYSSAINIRYEVEIEKV